MGKQWVRAQIKKNEIDDGWLSQIGKRHNLFPNLDYRVYA